MAPDDADELAWQLLRADDPRIADPHGPAGAIRVHDSDDGPAWVFFGRSPIAPFPPCRDAIAAQHNSDAPRGDGRLPIADATPQP